MKKILILLLIAFSFSLNAQKVGTFATGNTGDTYFDNYSNYLVRVSSDSGLIKSQPNTFRVLKGLKALNLLDSVKFLWTGEMGYKERVSGIYHYATKLYSNGDSLRDAVQTTEANQPTLSGNIAPTEHLCLNNANGASSFVSHPEIAFSATDSWSVTFAINHNGSEDLRTSICGGDGSGDDGNGIAINGYGDNTLYITFDEFAGYKLINLSGENFVGKINIITITKKDDTLNVYQNGNLIGSNTNATNLNPFTFKFILTDHNFFKPFNGKFYGYLLHEQFLNPTQVTAVYNLSRSIIPEMETVTIGTQTWATSNCDIVTTCMGTVIPNVTDNAAWAALTTPAWCYYNNDPVLGSVYGKFYNWYAVKQVQDDIDAYNLANPLAHWGYHVPTSTELNTLATYLGGASVAGGKLKMTGLNYWNTPNTGATNEYGFTMLPAGYRDVTGDILYNIKYYSKLWLIDMYASRFDFDNTVLTIEDESPVIKRGYSLRFIKD